MKVKKAIALLLAAMMMLALASCNLQTNPNDNPNQGNQGGQGNQGNQGGSSNGETVHIKLAYNATDEIYANVLRDQLTKGGFDVEMAAHAEAASLRDAKKNGNFDICISSWGNVIGTPDYGCRGVWHSQGDGNLEGINDPKVDELVEKGAGETSDKYLATYSELEKYVTEEMCYQTPLFMNMSARSFNKVIDPDSFYSHSNYTSYKYVDSSLTDTRPIILSQNGSAITTWDCVRANDSSSGTELDSMYICLVQMNPDNSITTKGSLSYNFAVAEDNSHFYFLLRDDCHFARIDKDGKVYDSGVMVAGEDVVYSLGRSMDPDSVPLHKTYSNFTKMEGTEIVTDMAELENTKTGDGKTVKEVLEANHPIDSLVATRGEVDNAAGKYQVVKVTTSIAFPQILNSLCGHGAGIVDSEYVAEFNKDMDVANYDASKDRIYGDSVCTMEGDTYDNHLSLSGYYVLTSMNDYQINFEANPYIFMNDKDYHPIKNLVMKFIADNDAALSSLRSGDIDAPGSIPTTKFDIVREDENLDLKTWQGNRVYVLAFNMHGNSEVSKSADLRKAIASCINYSDFEAVLTGNCFPAYSYLSSVLETGNTLGYQAGDTQKYLDAYFASK